MLKIINELKPFFEDCYRRISVREYARIFHISPPTASKLLHSYMEANLLVKEAYRNYLLFSANKESKEFIDLSRMYWRQQLEPALSILEKNLTNPTVILFGSLSKAEAKKDSDVDLAIIAIENKLNLESAERKLKRKIQLLWFKSLDNADKELAKNITNGYVLKGRL